MMEQDQEDDDYVEIQEFLAQLAQNPQVLGLQPQLAAEEDSDMTASSDSSDEEFFDAQPPDGAPNGHVQGDQPMDDLQPVNGEAEQPRRRERGLFSRIFDRSTSCPVKFNQALPAAHLYLGPDMEEVPGGQVVYEPDTVLEDVILFPLTHLILMPGQTLPLQYLHPRSVAMFRRIIDKHRIFGAISRKSTGEFNKYGTIAQVVQYHESNPEEGPIRMMKIRAIGRQRFRLLEATRQLDGTHCSRVKILEDYLPSGCTKCVNLPSLDRYVRLTRHHQSNRLQAIATVGRHLMPVPSHALAYYDVDALINQLVDQLGEWYDRDRVRAMGESSPIHLSYWIAAALPIDDGEKLRLFSMDSALQRLRTELDLLLRCTKFVCAECASVIGDKTDVFPMSVDGPASAYVNPGGHIHETLTLRRVSNVDMYGRNTTEHSWFPGYAWRILQCGTCQHHLGWRFKATSSNLDPHKFWGITRTAIKPLMVKDQDEMTPQSTLE